jgi:hypothetical protein
MLIKSYIRDLLKIGSLAIMSIDHYAFARLGEFVTFTRGAFVVPVFSFLLVLGLRQTRSKEKYLLRLLLFGLLAQVPYCLFFHHPLLYRLNILLVFFVALAMLAYMPKNPLIYIFVLFCIFYAHTMSWFGITLAIVFAVYWIVELLDLKPSLSVRRRYLPAFQKYFFYSYYPAHLLLLFFVGLYLS